MPFSIKANLKGLDKIVKKLQQLGKDGKKVIKKAVSNSSKILLKSIKQSAKSLVRKRTGLLYKSLGRKIKVYRNSGIVVAIIGPRKGYKTQIGVRKRSGTKSNIGDPIYADPVRYAHLVELGTIHSRSFPFMKKGLERSIKDIRDQMLQDLRDGLLRLKDGN